MSELSNLLLDFLAYQQEQSDVYKKKYTLLSTLLERNCLDLFEKEWKIAEVELQKSTEIDALYYHHDFTLHSAYYDYLVLYNNRHPIAHQLRSILLQKIDVYYLVEKLRRVANLLSSSAILKDYTTEQNADFLEQAKQLLQMATADHFFRVPLINLYYYATRLFVFRDNADYELLMQQVAVFEKDISITELSVLYKFAFNYCAQQIIINKVNMWQQIDTLYSKILALGILLVNGQISPVEFKNIVTTKYRLGKYTEAQIFIETYKDKLPKSDQLVATYLNGQTAFYLKQYQEALTCLAEVEMTDSIDRIQVNMLQIKCYFEQLYDPMASTMNNRVRARQEETAANKLSAFDEYLKAHKGINNQKRLTYRNFVRLTRRLFTLYEKKETGAQKDKKDIPQQTALLKSDIQKLSPIDADWLLSKL